MNRKLLLIFIIFVVAVAVIGFVLWRKTKEKPTIEDQLTILYAEKATEDQKVSGLKIIKRGEKKLIKNEAEGYSIEVPLNLLIARTLESSELYFFLPEESGDICEDPECSPLMTIRTIPNPENLSLKEWAQKEEEMAGYPMFEEKTELLINGKQAFRIEEETLRTSLIAYYFLASTNKVYEISIGAALEPEYKVYVESFKYE